MLAGRVTLVTAVPPEVAANSWVPAEFEVRLTVVAVPLVAALPKASSRVTVKALVALLLVVLLNAVEVKASWVPVPAVIVACWVPEVSPVAAAVMIGVPVFSSP